MNFIVRQACVGVLGALVIGAAPASAVPVTFGGSYDGTYEPDAPNGTGTFDANDPTDWTIFTNEGRNIVPNSPSAGFATLNDFNQSTGVLDGRIAINRTVPFDAVPADDEYEYTATMTISSAVQDDVNTAYLVLGMRDEGGSGKTVMLGWFLDTNSGTAGNQSRFALVTPTTVNAGSVLLNTVDYADNSPHAYRVRKFIDTDAAMKIQVFVDNVQVGSTLLYSSLGAAFDDNLATNGFGFFDSTSNASSIVLDDMRYGTSVPEPAAVGLLVLAAGGLLRRRSRAAE